MIKHYKQLCGAILIAIGSFCTVKATAQSETIKHRIGIFAPLYLDSAFNELGEYRFTKNNFPKYINPGLEFYEGAHLALDSLNKEYAPLEVFIYDTRSAKETLADQLNKPETDSLDLIIAHCSTLEVKQFADAGLRKNIPVINANLPNDGGTTGNPFFVLLNPTLRTQCEGIYRHIQKYYSLNPVIVFRKKGSLEDRIKTYFDEFGSSTMGVPLKLKYVELTDSFTVNQLRPYLDTLNNTLCISGSLDENFGKRLTQQLAGLKKQKYLSTVMGMPTWDNIKDFNKPDYKGIEIIYSNPFYNAKTDKVSQSLINQFNTVMYARPSDMVFRGYEVTWKYARLLIQHGGELASNLSNKNQKVFTDFDIQPVLNKQTLSLDYFENKKLYFLKWQDGVLKSIY
ncbi:MAG TPA: amino acid ABC transporter substrate-binding protein [Chitinophagaceae bacterium]|nr:amino acid ABC transporter substrate-binding protein [Chitinophagaceae bacterium]